MRSPVRLTVRGFGPALAASVFACTLAALPAPASARQADHPVPVPEGDIKIHGHWVIEVRNPDGGLAERREFDNALTADGRISLASYLNRASTFAFWVVELSSITTIEDFSFQDGPCFALFAKGDSTRACYIFEPSGAPAAPLGVSTSLAKAIGPNQVSFILSGHVTASQDGTIDRVATIRRLCPNTVAPADCITTLAFTRTPFTSHLLRDAQGAPAPIVLVPGQIVQVTIAFSFCGSEGCQS